MGCEIVEFGPGQRDLQMQGAGFAHGNIGEIDGGFPGGGKLNFGFFCRFPDALHGSGIPAQIQPVFLPELLDQIIGYTLIEIVTAQMVVAGGGQHLDDAGGDLQNGNVKGAAAQIINHDLLAFFFIHTVGQSGSSGFVDDAFDLQTGNASGIFGCLTLGIGEISRHGDYGFPHGMTQISFGIGLQLLQDHGRDLLRRIALAVDGHFIIGAHLPLDGRNGAVVIGDSLSFGDLAHHPLAGFGESHHRRGGAAALCVGNDNGLAAFHDGNAAVGGAKVNSDDTRHRKTPSGNGFIHSLPRSLWRGESLRHPW